MCLFTYGSEDTANELAEGSSYQNISMVREMGAVDWEMCHYVQKEIETSMVDGDCILTEASLIV